SEIAAAWEALPYERLGLTRTECFADCPEYSFVFIRASGGDSRARARYEGRAQVPELGVHEGSLSLRQYAELCLLTDHLGFLELEPEYRAPWPGDASAILEVRHATGDHQVVDYGRQGPPELIALELAFDGAAAGVPWQPLPPEDAEGAPGSQDGVAEE
ncbi:MAG TPA: DUF6438 domain-containing protein, partial [Polyangiaceae bacterium]|nr:DUF6438 domain-containing protein [Polyangiaceae bacterium]